MRLALATLIAVLDCTTGQIGSALAEQPYQGSWAVSVKACTEPNDGNLRITADNYYEHEGSCEIRKSIKTGSQWTLDLACEGEGEKWNKKTVLDFKGDKLRVGSAGQSLVRCKGGMQPPNWPVAD